MKNPILAVLVFVFASVFQPTANAQFGSGIVFDPTQSGHAITQIEHEERSIANQAQQIEQGQQIFPNTPASRSLPSRPLSPGTMA